MKHLFNSVVRVKRNGMTVVNGRASVGPVYMPAPLNNIPCRLDLTFMRQGKDSPGPSTSGKAPDRTGVMFLGTEFPIRAGDIIETISGPINGSFEIRAIPDIAEGYGPVGHHLEVQVLETNQNLDGVWPSPDGVDPV